MSFLGKTTWVNKYIFFGLNEVPVGKMAAVMGMGWAVSDGVDACDA